MKFETKFNLKDRAWYMKDNKPVEVSISAIYTFYVNTNQDQIKYSGKDVINPKTWIDHQNLFEGILFTSKDDLLNSFKGGNKMKCDKEENKVKHILDNMDVAIEQGKENARLNSVENMAINIIIDDSNPQNPVFIEIETDEGKSICIGEELKDENGYRKLRITTSDIINHIDI